MVQPAQREQLHRRLVEAVQQALEASGLAAAVPMPTTVVTADGGSRPGEGWSALDLVEGVRAALASAGLVAAQVDPMKAVVQGATLLASAPEGRSRFRSAEGTPPPPPAPGLFRW
uniref:Uncharacterized protein n=1 Tax=Alexandrium monilatum TaxID=311494 RepID=A0A7S4Q7H2_9DINO